MRERKICTALIFILLFGMLSGCGIPLRGPDNDKLYYTSFREIPGVTPGEIREIEALREQYSHFVYGMLPSTEAFEDLQSSEINGYAVLYCQWMTELFGIEFKPVLYEWGELVSGLESGAIDFSGELTPTDERHMKYIMTDPIAVRIIKSFRLKGSGSLEDIAKSRPVRYLFLGGATTIHDVTAYLQNEYEIIPVYDYEAAYEKLKNGEGDAFFAESNVEAAFDDYTDVVTSDFLPLIYSPVSMVTQNPRLAPIISVIQKALLGNDIHYMTEMYKQGYREYLRHKLYLRFDEEEKDYIATHSTVPFAAEYENYPMSFYNTQEKAWQGIVFDVLREVENLTDLSFTLVNSPTTEWPEIKEMLDKREVSIVSELIRTPDREGSYLWPSTVLMTDNYALISKAEHPNISINEILYVKVGVPRNTAYHELFNTWFPNHRNMVLYEGSDIAFKALARDEVDMTIASMYKLLALTNYREETGYKANIMFDRYVESTFGLNIEETILCSILDKTLAMIDTEGIADQWTRKTYDYRIRLTQAQIPWIIGATSLLVVLIFVYVFLYRNRREGKRLNKLVQIRTAELELETATIKSLEEAAKLRENMTNALNEMSIVFLAQDDNSFEETMTAGVKLLADMIDLDSLSVWRNYAMPDGLYTSQVYRWGNDASGNMAPRPELQNVPLASLTLDWEKILVSEKVLNGPVRLMVAPPVTFKRFGVVSALLTPLFFNNEYWGFVLFEDLHQERYFENIEFMRSAAFLYANAFIRSEMESQLKDALFNATAASRAKSEFLANMSHEIRT
ncbi:MAG: transporter substrate-binding domain-containing protein, partial [Peptococcaceae bacterium]|nr:transporter substrate-binding domain-containing protein [Peptococcaceae bacterium]